MLFILCNTRRSATPLNWLHFFSVCVKLEISSDSHPSVSIGVSTYVKKAHFTDSLRPRPNFLCPCRGMRGQKSLQLRTHVVLDPLKNSHTHTRIFSHTAAPARFVQKNQKPQLVCARRIIDSGNKCARERWTWKCTRVCFTLVCFSTSIAHHGPEGPEAMNPPWTPGWIIFICCAPARAAHIKF